MSVEFGLAEVMQKDAALLLASERHRSAASRAYYACYHACVALMEQRGLKPSNYLGRTGRPAGRWEHGIVTRQVARDPRLRVTLTDSLAFQARWLYAQRIRADYRPDDEISSETAQLTVQVAQQIIQRVKEATDAKGS
jgi:uncharacterized protein (UPF0332 family)